VLPDRTYFAARLKGVERAGQADAVLRRKTQEENSISGDGCRPLSNACALGEARGLASIAQVVMSNSSSSGAAAEAGAALWANFSSIFREALTGVLWNEDLNTFSTLAVPKPGCNATPGERIAPN
jgi:hypothetical protein